MAHIPGAVAPQAESKYLTALLTIEASWPRAISLVLALAVQAIAG